MNLGEKIIYFLQGEMERPKIYGWFHLIWIMLTIISCYFLIKTKKSEKKLNIVLFIYGFISLVLEILKQVVWSFNYNSGVVTWDYNWYAFPFQLCSTPMYVALICAFLKKGKLKDALLSYIAFITILGSLATFLYPDSCFVKTILVNIHTMYLHCGSLVISIYLLATRTVKLDFKNLSKAYYVFIILALIAESVNLVMYHSGILNGETFNMFYISPYFISVLPFFDFIQEHLPFTLFLLIYLSFIYLGGFITYLIFKLILRKKSI